MYANRGSKSGNNENLDIHMILCKCFINIIDFVIVRAKEKKKLQQLEGNGLMCICGNEIVNSLWDCLCVALGSFLLCKQRVWWGTVTVHTTC